MHKINELLSKVNMEKKTKDEIKRILFDQERSIILGLESCSIIRHIKEDLMEIKNHVSITNGRVTKIEKWKYRIEGAIGLGKGTLAFVGLTGIINIISAVILFLNK